jgi:hypothetical protein
MTPLNKVSGDVISKNNLRNDSEMNKQTEIITLLPETILIDEKLGAIDLPTLLSVCVDLLTICARRSTEIDPAVAAMVAYARDEVCEHVSNDRSLGRSWSASTPQTTRGRAWN